MNIHSTFAQNVMKGARTVKGSQILAERIAAKHGCGICGGYPVGTDCSHQCPNSVHYYSPERERYDDMIDDGSDDIRERYAGELIGLEEEDPYETVETVETLIESVRCVHCAGLHPFLPCPLDTDDIPF